MDWSCSWIGCEIMTLANKLIMCAAGESLIDIGDVFSTFSYTGDYSARDIENGIDLDGDGGLVWIKGRSGASRNHYIYDTERTLGKSLSSNLYSAESVVQTYFDSFNSNGFSLNESNVLNALGETFVSWTFKKATRFFDVVKYTGNGVSGREISHDLGITPGMMIIKNLDDSNAWILSHRSIASDEHLRVNSTRVALADSTNHDSTFPTDTVFTVGNSSNTNSNSVEYIAYLFAHDPLGPSGDGSDGLSVCGSYIGNGSSQTVDCGFSAGASFFIVKAKSAAGSWWVYDSVRGVIAGNDPSLQLNTEDAEKTSTDAVDPTTSGIIVNEETTCSINATGVTYVFYAVAGS